MSEMPANQKELLSRIEHEWTALMDAVAHLDEKQMTTPDAGGWSPKDNLSHLADWMNVLLGYHMDRRPAHEVLGVSAEVTKDWNNYDAINAVLFERNRTRTTEDVLNGLKQVYARVTARLESMPFAELLKPRQPEDPQSGTLLGSVIGNTYEHFAEHRETMEKNRKP